MQHLILKIRAQSDLVSFDQQFFPFIDIFLLTSNDIVLKKKEKNYIHEIKSTLLVSERKKKFISVRTRSRVFDKASSYFIRIKISDIKLDSSQLENRTFILKRICFESKR